MVAVQPRLPASLYRNAVSIVAPIELFNGKPSGKALSTRPAMESRDEVKAKLAEATARTARLPLVDEAVAQAWLKESEQDISASAPRRSAEVHAQTRGRILPNG